MYGWWNSTKSLSHLAVVVIVYNSTLLLSFEINIQSGAFKQLLVNGYPAKTRRKPRDHDYLVLRQRFKLIELECLVDYQSDNVSSRQR